MSRFNAILLLLLPLAVLLAPHPAKAAESYGNCTSVITTLPVIIGTSGTWCLEQNLPFATNSGAAITIEASDVTLDCNDFNLDGSAAGINSQAYGITANGHFNLTIRHCNVRGFFVGVNFINGGSHLVEQNRFDGNTYLAISVDGVGSIVQNNRVFNTGGSLNNPAAIGIAGNYGTNFLDNTVSGVVARSGGGGNAYGISTTASQAGSISRNRVRGVVKDGPGTAYAIANYNYGNGPLILRGNDLVGDGNAGSTGIWCAGANCHAKDNVISGFGTALSNCGNNGGNVIKP
jgi:hypothetical protein